VLTGSQSEAEELVQEAIVKTLVAKPRLSEPAAAEQYIRKTMRTLVIDKARKQARFLQNAPREARAEAMPDGVLAISDRVAVSRALQQLTAQQRLAVALRYWDDMTVDDVAAAMKVRSGTVKRYLFDAAAVLRPVLGEHVEQDESSGVTVVRHQERRGGA